MWRRGVCPIFLTLEPVLPLTEKTKTGIREKFLMCRLEIQSNYHLPKQSK